MHRLIGRHCLHWSNFGAHFRLPPPIRGRLPPSLARRPEIAGRLASAKRGRPPSNHPLWTGQPAARSLHWPPSCQLGRLVGHLFQWASERRVQLAFYGPVPFLFTCGELWCMRLHAVCTAAAWEPPKGPRAQQQTGRATHCDAAPSQFAVGGGRALAAPSGGAQWSHPSACKSPSLSSALPHNSYFH